MDSPVQPSPGGPASLFEYRAIDEQGKLHQGLMEGQSPADIQAYFDRAGMTVLSARPAAKQERSWRERLTPEPPPQDITGFTQDLAMLLKGGVSLDESLAILTTMETRRWLVRLIKSMQADLAGGKSLSRVLAQHPRLFPKMYVKIVEAAEMSGRLQQALTAIATERQRGERLRKRLIGAMAYPGFLAVAAVGVMFFVLLYIIPQFEGAIVGYRDKIAPSTLIVFNMSQWLRDNLDLLGIGVVVLLVVVVVAKRLLGRASVGIVILSRLPFTRRMVSYNLTLNFCRVLAMLLQNGVDISTSLALIRDILTVPGADRRIDAVIGDVRGGKRLSDALAAVSLLPTHVVQMLRVGEGAGTLGESADRIAAFYESKLDTALGQFTAVIGPVLMMLVSVIVGWLIISVMSALMSINDLIA